MNDFPELNNLFDDAAPSAPTIVFHPAPVPSRCCGIILQATYAAENDYSCPECGERVCYTCGCVDGDACTMRVSTADGARSVTYICGWAAPGICSFCHWRAAYELYQEATGRAADDAYYMTLGRSVRAVRGLTYGV